MVESEVVKSKEGTVSNEQDENKQGINRPTFCTGSQQMNRPNEEHKRSNGALPELLLVKKKLVSKVDNLSSMHSLNHNENPFEFSTKNNYVPDETKLTIFSEDPQIKTLKAMTQRNKVSKSKKLVLSN